MPKAKAMKFYAVAVGWDAPNIYTTWDECSAKVSRYPKALHRSFKTREEAEKWLESKADMTALYSQENLNTIAKVRRNSSTPVDLLGPPQNGIASEPAEIKPDAPEQKVILSAEQSRVFARAKEGKNVFFTGSAGTGKSVLLREVIKLKKNPLSSGEPSSAIAITASTGIAAINIGGVTLHSWAGIKLGDEPVDRFIGKVRHQPLFEAVLRRWQDVETLIIDEISMIDGSLFDYLEEIARELRRSSRPFGGIQLILCGDFCQLPPVPNKDPRGRKIPAKFAFEAETWNSCIGAPLLLKKVFRQKDQTFANMLNEMRCGKMQESTIEIFKDLNRQVTYTDGIEPTEMYPTRKEVHNANNFRLSRLPGKLSTYDAQDHKGVDHKGEPITHQRMLEILDNLVAPKSLELKVGAQVMLIKNLVQGVLVNGSIGQVTEFVTPEEAIASGTKIAQVEADKTNGQGGSPATNAVAREILRRGWKWPVVKFTNGLSRVMTPVDFTVNNGDGETLTARRLQLPLILAWALSVHKSQGQTLERVRVDLKRTFEKGQAYVALSRATTMEQLQVLNFSKEKVMAHSKVLAWYGENIDTSEDDSDIDDDEFIAFDECHF